MRVIETVYKGRDNRNDLLLKANGVAVDLSAVTKIELVGDGLTISSTTIPGAFDWSVGGGVVNLSLGSVEDLSIGVNVFSLIVYDPDNLSGIHWGELILDIK